MKNAICTLLLSTVFLTSLSQGPCDDSTNRVSIYLTFDDGPLKSSQHLVNLLKADSSIKFTVFLIGNNVFCSSEGKNILEFYRNSANVEIANHSFYHAHKKYKRFYSSPGEVVKDILLNEDTLNLTNKTVRLPGRNAWRVNGNRRNDLPDVSTAADSLAKLGFRVFGWDLQWEYDTLNRSVCTGAEILNQVDNLLNLKRSNLTGHIVILCHDPMLHSEFSRHQLKLFIEGVRARNWSFKLLRDYPSGVTY